MVGKRGAHHKELEIISDEVILREGNISLILYSYNDMFSDFDPRPYSERALSDDFLLECRKASSGKEKKIELRLLVPSHKRNFGDESKIRKRIKTHFQKHFKEKQEEQSGLRREGAVWFMIGGLLIITATLIYELKGFLFNLLFVIMEPAGWFTAWNGLEKIFLKTKEKMPDYEFYKKMANAKINFYSY